MKYLKQIILAVFVVGAFVLYSYHQSHDDGAAVVAPSALNTGAATPDAATSSSASPATAAAYKDGSYTGSAADAFYGDIQVKAVISGGKLTDVQFLQYPNDRRQSVNINTQAMPYLKQEAIQAQSAHVDIITGATDSSQAFVRSLGSALAQAD